MKLIVPLVVIGSLLFVNAVIPVQLILLAIESTAKAIGEGGKTINDRAYVRIVNTMGPNIEITANCASADDKIDEVKRRDGEAFLWEFRDNIWGSTLFWCDVTTSDGKKKHWDVYTTAMGKNGINWYLRGDGIYRGKFDGSELEKKHDWE